MGPGPRLAVALLLIASLVVPALASSPTGATDGPIAERVTVGPAGDETVEARIAYDLPPGVNELVVTVRALERGDARLVALEGFERRAEGLAWTGGADPAVRIALDGTASPSAGTGVVTGDGWALLARPATSFSYRYQGPTPTVERSLAVAGRGYAADGLAYVGPVERTTVTAGGERATLVVGAAANVSTVTPALSFLRTAPGRFDLGVRRDRLTAFVLPAGESATGRHVTGVTVETAFWVRPEAVAFERTGTAFTHEYVHTRLGRQGNGSAAWLTEGIAEYVGRLAALNAGAGSYEGFRRGLRADRYAPNRTAVVLAEPTTWRATLADYRKGAHVLAALDAEIRRRTDRTLVGVIAARPGPYADHAAFREAVVAETGAPALGDWIDRYVAGEALPPPPTEPRHAVLGGGLDPDGDGVTSAREVARDRHPFVAGPGTPTPTATATATPAATTPTTTAGGSETATAGRTRTGAAGDGLGAPAAVLGVSVSVLVGTLAARARR